MLKLPLVIMFDMMLMPQALKTAHQICYAIARSCCGRAVVSANKKCCMWHVPKNFNFAWHAKPQLHRQHRSDSYMSWKWYNPIYKSQPAMGMECNSVPS